MADLAALERQIVEATTKLAQLAEDDVRLREELARIDDRIKTFRDAFHRQMAAFWKESGNAVAIIETAEQDRERAIEAGNDAKKRRINRVIVQTRGTLHGLLKGGKVALQPFEEKLHTSHAERDAVEQRLQVNTKRRAELEAERKRLEDDRKRVGNPTHIILPKITAADIAKHKSVVAAAQAKVVELRASHAEDSESAIIFDADYTGAIGMRSRRTSPEGIKEDIDWVKRYITDCDVRAVTAEEKKK